MDAVVAMPGIGQVGGNPLVNSVVCGVYFRTPPVSRYGTTWDVNVNLKETPPPPVRQSFLGAYTGQSFLFWLITFLRYVVGHHIKTIWRPVF